MLQLSNLKKTYKIGEIETKALDGISVSFREKEFVSILGQSGSGKTTCLNIIGGLDRYDSGEMIIKGKNTKNFKDKDWDAYRNNSIGFVFQSYNLISHLSIVANVELSMTLSGVSASEKREKALEVLKRVGLKEHLHKKPNQLSGGQMQRVAIARALVNDPEILLCDEPTGALDTETSVQIMDLIQEISQDRLVVMVTHNPELAEKYSDRIIKFSDGKIIDDSNPYEEKERSEDFKIRKTSMSFLTALRLSFNNIRTKKGRTFLTSFASSIGIIGIALILSLSNGFQIQIDQFQEDAMSEFPIIVGQSSMEMNEDTMKKLSELTDKTEYVDSDEVFLYDSAEKSIVHKNIFTEEYMTYIQNIDPKICSSLGYARLVNMNLVRKIDGIVQPVTITTGTTQTLSQMSGTSGGFTSMKDAGMSSYPVALSESEVNYLENNYQLLYGDYPNDKTDVVLVINQKNEINYETLKALGFKTDNVDSIKFSDIVGTEFKLISNNDLYNKMSEDMFVPSNDYEKMYDSDESITIKISGIVRQSPDSQIGLLASGLAYSDELSQMVIDNNLNSEIVKVQKESEKNVFTGQNFNEGEKEMFLATLGGSATPFIIMLYPNSFDSKEDVVAYLDQYNQGKETKDIVVYTDLAASISDMTGGIMTAITWVLVAFAAISLIVSLIMICIITYTSVLERTKEIGILKALGARKKDITRVFDAETFILGVFSGVLGVIIAFTCTIPINQVIYNVTELKNVAQLELLHAVSLIFISTVLTVLGGHIPARMASKKDAVEALRSE